MTAPEGSTVDRRRCLAVTAAAALLALWDPVRRLLIPALWKPCERFDGRRWVLTQFPRLKAGDVVRIPAWVFPSHSRAPFRCLGDAYRDPCAGVWAVTFEPCEAP